MNALVSPIYYNDEAVHILAYPGIQTGPDSLASFFGAKIRSVLIDHTASRQPAFLPGFISGKRYYVCRTSFLNSALASKQDTDLAILMERRQQRVFNRIQLAAEFHLSQRETEAIELVVYGLTSKEIANRMQISPSTVKAFLRLAMAKMDVTTRAGLVGRIFETPFGAGV